MEQAKIDRINELAAKLKKEGLTEEEAAERKQLHAEYIAAYKANLHGILSNTYIQRPDGTREKLVKKTNSSKK